MPINQNENLKISSLDFDTIKENIINHLKADGQFTDYDFNGSAMSVVLNALAYTTHYISVYNNLSLSEVFLDSAQLRNSVVSKAKELNYMPRQRQASIAVLSISVDTGSSLGPSVLIPRNTKFSSEIDGESYEFVTVDDVPLLPTTGTEYASESVSVYQGTFQKQSWTVLGGSNQRYVIENDGVDTRYLTMKIYAQQGSTNITNWYLNEDITEADQSSTIYFAQEASNGRIELYFGDGVVGRVPINDNYIEVEFLSSKGQLANGCSNFELVNDIGLISRGNFNVSTITKASEGSERESIESIKLLAPKSFQAQNRAVTVADYEQLIKKQLGSIETMNIWGGEDNIPPEYGKVFICIKPQDAEEVSPATKLRIEEDILNRYNVVGVRPVIVDPDYTYIDMETTITVNLNNTTVDRGQLVTLTEQTIRDYFVSDLNSFGTSFRYSRIVRAIDDTDQSIISNRSSITFSKKFIPLTTQPKTYQIFFNGGILPNSLYSNLYGFEPDETVGRLKLRDDGEGKLVYTKVQKYTDGGGNVQYIETIFDDDIGTVNYSTGEVTIKSFLFLTPLNTEIILTSTPVSDDVLSLRNNLLVAGDNINVTLEELIDI